LAPLLSRDPSLAHQCTPTGNAPLHVVSQAKQDEPAALNNEGKTAAQWYRRHGMDLQE
jgi:hypothetical protein